MKQVYHFDPIPTELDSIQKQLVLGGECNLWSEHIPNEKKLDEMVFPRMLAMSEVLSYPKERNYDTFLARADNHAHLLRSYGVNVGLDAFPVKFQPSKTLLIRQKLAFILEEKIFNLNISGAWIVRCHPWILLLTCQ